MEVHAIQMYMLRWIQEWQHLTRLGMSTFRGNLHLVSMSEKIKECHLVQLIRLTPDRYGYDNDDDVQWKCNYSNTPHMHNGLNTLILYYFYNPQAGA